MGAAGRSLRFVPTGRRVNLRTGNSQQSRRLSVAPISSDSGTVAGGPCGEEIIRPGTASYGACSRDRIGVPCISRPAQAPKLCRAKPQGKDDWLEAPATGPKASQHQSNCVSSHVGDRGYRQPGPYPFLQVGPENRVNKEGYSQPGSADSQLLGICGPGAGSYHHANGRHSDSLVQVLSR